MTGLYFLFPTLLAIFISVLMVRAGAMALMMTGLDRQRATFQSLSAFTGTGFTTQEAELVATHPLRRRIVSLLMILGNVGIVTVIITATSSLLTTSGYTLPIHFVLFVIGLYLIYRIGKSRKFIRRWEGYIERKLSQNPAFEGGAAEDLLHFLEGYGLVRKVVGTDSRLIGVSLADWLSGEQDIIVLGIERAGKWVPVPTKHDAAIQDGDRLVLYGKLEATKKLFADS
jgi:hypothetical protein